MPVNNAKVTDCLFCKIAAGQIPCARVYEDDHILAFLDINPIAKGHTLVLPKAHYPTLLDVPESEGGPVINALRRIAVAVQQECKADGFNCIQNNFAAAGQMVFHSHWHIIPRFENDGLPDWPGSPYPDPQEMQSLAQAISNRVK